MIDKSKLDEIREDIKDILDLIDLGIERVEIEAKSMSCDPMALRMPDGTWVMHHLLRSKVEAYHDLLIIDVLEREIDAQQG